MSRKKYIRNWFSNMLEFDRPLRHQGIEYRTVENFYQAMKTAKDDLETRRRIAAASPYEAKRLGRGVQLRADWAEGRGVSDGQGENHLGRLLMRLRDEWRKAG